MLAQPAVDTQNSKDRSLSKSPTKTNDVIRRATSGGVLKGLVLVKSIGPFRRPNAAFTKQLQVQMIEVLRKRTGMSINRR